jgi:hypothetical protein
MKTLFKQLLSGLSACIIGITAYAQQLHYVYVAPTATLTGAFGAANVSGFTRDSSGVQVAAMTGYRQVLVTPANAATFYTIAAPNLRRTYDSLNTATSSIRRKLNPILAFTGNQVRDIYLFLVDDRTGMPNNSPFCDGIVGGLKIAWPCALNWKVGNNYIARVSVGEGASYVDINKAGGFKRWEATILHEFSHTQMLRDTVAVNKWDDRARGIDGIAISYGGDAGHWFQELQADQQQPMDEGLGNFWALEYNPPSATEMDAFLNNSNPRFLLGSRSFLSGIGNMWNAPHRVLCSGPLPCVTPTGDTISVRLNTNITPAGGGYELREYRWLDVPGEFVFYNELMSEAYFYLYHQYGFNSKDSAYNKLLSAVKTLCNYPVQRYRYPAHVSNMLANSMEAYARSAAGQAEQANNTLVSSMFAYALFDIITHFGMSDADLQREFDINSATYIPHTPKPIAFTQYFARRAQVKQIACPFLGGPNCAPNSTGAIDIHRAVREVRNYFTNAATILK